QGVAYRMLGSRSEADDAVQEAWLRLSRSDTSGVKNLAGWLTTVVARVCLDLLRSRNSRREEPLSERGPEALLIRRGGTDPERESAPRRLGRSRIACGARNPGPRRASCLRAARHVRPALRRNRSHRGALGDCGKATREPSAAPRARRGHGS